MYLELVYSFFILRRTIEIIGKIVRKGRGKIRRNQSNEYDRIINKYETSDHVVEALIQGATVSTVYWKEQGAVRKASPRGHIYTAPNKLSVAETHRQQFWAGQFGDDVMDVTSTVQQISIP